MASPDRASAPSRAGASERRRRPSRGWSERFADDRSQALAAHRRELIAPGRRLGLTGLRVFGSVLHGEDTEESDLDLVGTPAPGLDLFDLADFELAAEERPGVPVEVLTSGARVVVASRVRQEAQAI